MVISDFHIPTYCDEHRRGVLQPRLQLGGPDHRQGHQRLHHRPDLRLRPDPWLRHQQRRLFYRSVLQRLIFNPISAAVFGLNISFPHVFHCLDYYEDYAEVRDAGQESDTSLVCVSVLAGALGVILGGLFVRWVVRKARDRRDRGSLGQLTVVSVGESRGNQSGILATDWRDQLNPFANSS